MLLSFTDSEHLKLEIENLNRALESDAANYIVQETQKKAKKDINSSFGS